MNAHSVTTSSKLQYTSADLFATVCQLRPYFLGSFL